MEQEEQIFMGSAGSLTVGILLIVVAFLMRSFYKRFMGIDRSDDSAE
jgi:UDP-N-acetylmuramyl pentapeptide phosphotransferase/UDP-N-acetylglucosamine-1-phosphate transferase